MSITGHKSLSMFKRYAIVDASLQRKALEATEAHLANSILLRKGAAAIPSRATDTDKTRTIG